MKNQEISTFIGQKRAYNSSSFLLRVSKNEQNIAKNIAILAPKKIFKLAVLRNKVKRRLKNAINKVILDIHVEKKDNVDDIKKSRNFLQKDNILVFSLKKGVDTILFADLVKEIKQSLINNDII